MGAVNMAVVALFSGISLVYRGVMGTHYINHHRTVGFGALLIFLAVLMFVNREALNERFEQDSV